MAKQQELFDSQPAPWELDENEDRLVAAIAAHCRGAADAQAGASALIWGKDDAPARGQGSDIAGPPLRGDGPTPGSTTS